MRAASFPLLMAYAAYPIAAHVQRLTGLAITRNWIDAVWAAAGFTALLVLTRKRNLPATRHGVFLLAALLSVLALLTALRFGPQFAREVSLIPWLMEMKPLFYLCVGLLWFSAFGSPGPRAFISCGLILAALLLIEVAAIGLLTGTIVRPEGSGEINYDACLILVSLAVGLYSGRMNRTAHLILFAGLALTFSRTAMASAAVLYLLSPNRGPLFKTAVVVAATGLFLLSFSIRGLPLDALEQLDRLWMWKTGIELISEDPLRAIAGFAPGAPLPVKAPEELAALWSQQRSAWDLSGLYAYNFHSFWIRTALTWGLAVTAALLAGLVFMFHRARDGAVRGLVAISCVMGLTMGVFYLSNVAVPLILAFLTPSGVLSRAQTSILEADA